MKEYRRLQRLVACTLAFIFSVGLIGALTPRREIFPFASWFLFSLVPGHVREYDVIIHAPGGAPKVTSFSESEGLVSQPHALEAHELIQGLGHAVEIADLSAERELRTQLEKRIGGGVTQYDLVTVDYSPLERWRNESACHLEFVARFTPRQD